MNVSRETQRNTVALTDEIKAKVRTHGGQAMDRFLAYEPRTVYDVGAGHGFHAAHMRAHGAHVITVDPHFNADVRQPWDQLDMAPVDGIWCCHTLEHAANPSAWFGKFRDHLKPGGVLAVTVPPGGADMARGCIGGHINHFTEFTLFYHAALAGGFVLNKARFGRYGHNLSMIVQRASKSEPGAPPWAPPLQMNHDDLAKLQFSAPDGVTIKKGASHLWAPVAW